METVVVNAGRAKSVRANGRQWLVAPLSMIVPGVLPGSQGALLYTEADARQHAADWDGVPITHYHPADPITNDFLSASDRGVAERQHIGVVKGGHFSNGKSRGVGWFDAETTKRLAPAVYDALVQGAPMELSTGLYTNNVPESGTHGGRPYTAVAKDWRPDHLAILPSQVGACSLSDGCGLNVNSLAVNPAVSEAQRRYLNAQFGHEWVKEHGFDNRGELPEKSMAACNCGMKLSPGAKACPGCAKPTANSFWTDAGEFFRGIYNASFSRTNPTGQFASAGHGAKREATHQAARSGVTAPDESEDEAKVASEGANRGDDGRDISDVPRRGVKGLAGDEDGDEDVDADSHYLWGWPPKEVPGSTQDYGGGTRGGKKQATTNAWTDEARAASAAARAASAHAKEKGTAEAHEKAYDAHSKAGSLHSRAASHFGDSSTLMTRFGFGDRDARPTEADKGQAAYHEDAAAFHSDKAAHHERMMDKLTGNAQSRGGKKQATTNEWSDAAREASAASRKANASSQGTKDGGAKHAARVASAAASVAGLKGQTIAKARDAHNEAATYHRRAQSIHSKTGDTEARSNHAVAARLHEGASGNLSKLAHQSLEGDRTVLNTKTCPDCGGDVADGKCEDCGEKLTDNTRNTMVTRNDGHSLAGVDREQQKAAFAHMNAGGETSKDARTATKHANESGKQSHHEAAAHEHRQAAKAHKEEGNDEIAKAHTQMAKVHEKAARQANNQRVVEKLVRRGMISNCDAALAVLNDKAQGSNADVSGSGDFDDAIQAGGEEDDEEVKPKYDDETRDGGARGGSHDEFTDKVQIKKSSPQMNQRNLEAFSQAAFGMPLEDMRRVIHNGAQLEREKKLTMVRRLVANVEDAKARQQFGNALMAKSVEDLRMMVALVPPPVSNETLPRRDPVYAGAGQTLESNQQRFSDDEDILDFSANRLSASSIVENQRKQERHGRKAE